MPIIDDDRPADKRGWEETDTIRKIDGDYYSVCMNKSCRVPAFRINPTGTTRCPNPECDYVAAAPKPKGWTTYKTGDLSSLNKLRQTFDKAADDALGEDLVGRVREGRDEAIARNRQKLVEKFGSRAVRAYSPEEPLGTRMINRVMLDGGKEIKIPYKNIEVPIHYPNDLDQKIGGGSR